MSSKVLVVHSCSLISSRLMWSCLEMPSNFLSKRICTASTVLFCSKQYKGEVPLHCQSVQTCNVHFSLLALLKKRSSHYWNSPLMEKHTMKNLLTQMILVHKWVSEIYVTLNLTCWHKCYVLNWTIREGNEVRWVGWGCVCVETLKISLSLKSPSPLCTFMYMSHNHLCK